MGNYLKQSLHKGKEKPAFLLKLAEFELLKLNKGFAPILLLDDVFEKLDDLRMQTFYIGFVKKMKRQVFITDTHKERLEKRSGFTNYLPNY
jgi:DNA replication and repair protein RecF